MNLIDKSLEIKAPEIVFETHTSIEQDKVASDCQILYDEADDSPRLKRKIHIRFLLEGLRSLSRGHTSLDASRPWLVFWIIHSLELLGEIENMPKLLAEASIDFLARCQHPDGGFCGGPGQIPHLAPTYASISALSILGSRFNPRAYEVINRSNLYAFLLRLRTACGAFRVSIGGEMDTRGAYCAIAVASLTNIITPELTVNTAEWLGSCQTFEGGIGGEPGNEAHGGYTYCGLAAVYGR
jgi:protein farnesyltransferase subunit beta